MTKKKLLALAIPAVALFGAAVLLVVVIRSSMNAKKNNVSFLSMLGSELKFIFSFSEWGTIEVGQPE